MIQIDPKFTKEIQDWLNKAEHSDDDVLAGAQLLKRINPQNATYRRWLQMAASRPKYIVAHIERELKTHLRYRLDGLTLEQVNRLDSVVVPAAEKIIGSGIPVIDGEGTADENATDAPKKLGRREDHEQLPDEIKQLWNSNGELYKQIKAVFEELKSMEDLPSCQRYDKLTILDEMDKKYISQMAQYDSYKIQTDPKDPTDPNDPTDPSAPSGSSKDVANARSYISKNISKLEAIAGDKGMNSEEFTALKAKVEQRVNVIVAAKEPMGEALAERLADVGISVMEAAADESKPSEDGEGQAENDSPSAGEE